MKKLFISQPMRGLTDEQILSKRNAAIEHAKTVVGEELEVIESLFQDVPADAKPLWYLSKSLELMATADVVYFVDGWQEARGCIIEHDCAVAYGLNRIDSIT